MSLHDLHMVTLLTPKDTYLLNEQNKHPWSFPLLDTGYEFQSHYHYACSSFVFQLLKCLSENVSLEAAKDHCLSSLQIHS